MTINTFLILVAFSSFAAYNIYVLSVFGVPSNLSVTHYHCEAKRKPLGFLFPLLMLIQCLTLLPTWLKINTLLPTERAHDSVWLIYLTAGAILIVTLLTQYKKSYVRTLLHYSAAILSAITSLLWIFVVCQLLWYIPFIVFLLVTLAAVFTHTWYSCILYWLELVDFYSVFVTLFVLSITL